MQGCKCSHCVPESEEGGVIWFLQLLMHSGWGQWSGISFQDTSAAGNKADFSFIAGERGNGTRGEDMVACISQSYLYTGSPVYRCPSYRQLQRAQVQLSPAVSLLGRYNCTDLARTKHFNFGTFRLNLTVFKQRMGSPTHSNWEFMVVHLTIWCCK